MGRREQATAARTLLTWYDRNARELSWRVQPHDRKRGVVPDPYRVWLVEVMLQQTRVVTVEKYFDRFVHRWPTVQALAEAPVAEVMREWAGMGYYARARNLHASAKIIAEDFHGVVPQSEAELLRLPGVGDYTAAAITAIAYNKHSAPVDGNVMRVISRLYGLDTPLPESQRQIHELTHALVPARRPGDFVQALMDLGATVCTPRSPNCPVCPWRRRCCAYAEGRAAELPVRNPKPDRVMRYGVVFVARRRDGALLVERRAEPGMFGGMVVLPGTAWTRRRPTARTVRSAEPVQANWQSVDGVVEHSVSDFQIQLLVRQAVVGSRARANRGYWLPAAEVSREALPATMRKVLRLCAS